MISPNPRGAVTRSSRTEGVPNFRIAIVNTKPAKHAATPGKAPSCEGGFFGAARSFLDFAMAET